MPRKLTTLLCTLLLALLCACQSEPDTAIFCERQPGDSWNFQVVELDEHGGKRSLSDWSHFVTWQEPYLFHYVEENDGWRITSTAPDGSDERLWLDSSQLPEEYSEYRAYVHTMQFTDDTLYLLIHEISALSNCSIAMVDSSGDPLFFPVDGIKGTPVGEGYNSQYYYIAHPYLMALDTTTGDCTPVVAEPISGIAYQELFQRDNDLLWYLTADHEAAVIRLFGVDLTSGTVLVRQETNAWYEVNTLFIHDGYLFYFQYDADTRFHSLWEIPLTVFGETSVSWDSLFLDGGAAKLLAQDVKYTENFPPLTICFGRKGLWLCYTTNDSATWVNAAPGEIRYVPYGH